MRAEYRGYPSYSAIVPAFKSLPVMLSDPNQISLTKDRRSVQLAPFRQHINGRGRLPSAPIATVRVMTSLLIVVSMRPSIYVLLKSTEMEADK